MESSTQARRVRFGAFEADLHSGELHKHGLKIKLQGQPFQVLALLLEHSGELVTRERAAPETLAGRHLCGLRNRSEHRHQEAARRAQ